MQPLPHYYQASAQTKNEYVQVKAEGLPTLITAAPADFGGPGDYWSPETLLVGAIADCFILTFKAGAQAGNLAWQELRCEVEGVLDKVDRGMEFTEIRMVGQLVIDQAEDEARALKLMEKSEANCLISRSLKAKVLFEPLVTRATGVNAVKTV